MSDKPWILDQDPIPWSTPALLVIWPPEFPHRNVTASLETCVRVALELSRHEPPPHSFDIETDDYRLITGTEIVALAEMLPAPA